MLLYCKILFGTTWLCRGRVQEGNVSPPAQTFANGAHRPVKASFLARPRTEHM